jgi:acyl-CoA dehydrogenase
MSIDTDLILPFLTAEHLRLVTRLDTSVEDTILPLTPATDDEGARLQAREILHVLAAEGWTTYTVPPAYGGAEEAQGLISCCLIREALAAASPLADAVFALQCLGSMPVALGGIEELRLQWLPATAAGHAMAAFAMTEPEAGSDVAAIRTTAVLDGDEYVLSGHKWFISNAGIADYYVVFATTDREAGRHGLSAFLVPGDNPGLRFTASQVLSEPHPLGEIELEDCRVPVDHRLGAEGEGFGLGLRTLDRLRATVAAAACGMAARALQEARAHAATREQFGEKLADFQLVQAKLADMATELTAARMLTYRAAWEADYEGQQVTLSSSMAKLFATEAAQRVIDQAVQILGGRGTLAESPVDRLYRAVRALRIYEGTSEIQKLVIARELGRRGEDA